MEKWGEGERMRYIEKQETLINLTKLPLILLLTNFCIFHSINFNFTKVLKLLQT